MDKFDKKTYLDLLTTMLRIRLVEEFLAEKLTAKEIRCPVHLYIGQEGIAAGVCQNLHARDYVFSTHRSHGHYIAKGGDIKKLVAEIFCKATGCSNGYGGSMHIVDTSVNYLASSAIVAGSIPLAVGTALASILRGEDRISVAFFGDGATDEGVFWEALNCAALYQLPVLFVCENNLFSTHMPLSLRQANVILFEKAAAFGLTSERIEGNDTLQVYKKAQALISRMRIDKKPAFLECMTFRWLAHVGPTPDLDIGYRKKKDVEAWQKKCPIKQLKNHLIEQSILSEQNYAAIVQGIQNSILEAYQFTKASAPPSPDDYLKKIKEYHG